jgi:DNA-binding beta-propeller fold protein YncE
MKTVWQIFLAAGLALFASTGFAALKLKQPAGLAVDATGNLYVANFGFNNILVYSPKYVQLFNKTIKQNISGPEAVALDTFGNVWVANFTGNANGPSGYITEYTGVTQNTDATISNDITGPLYLAFDGLDNLWVLDDGMYVTVYSPTTAFAPPSNLLYEFDTPLTTLTVGPGLMASGTSTNTYEDSSSVLLQGTGTIGMEVTYGLAAAAMASDNLGNIYSSDPSGQVRIFPPNFGGAEGFVSLGFKPRGMAVDNKNKRLYASNEAGNEIVVYSTVTGELLETIANTD